MTKLYSNTANKQLIASMIQKGREPHSVLITGEPGGGKKALARYLAAALLCEEHTGEPCGKCRSCRMINDDVHPDLITAKSNENGNYRLDDIRALVSDTVVKPNEGRLKVYLIPDFDRSVSTAQAVQNVLLKAIEEPPAHCVMILTAATKEVFLPTIISRVVKFAAEPCSRHDAEEWLTLLGRFEQTDVIRAVGCCGGNFGRCLEFLEGGELRKAYDCARAAVEQIAEGSEYGLVKVFAQADAKGALLKQALQFLCETARSGCLLSAGAVSEAELRSREAGLLSKKLGQNGCERLYTLAANTKDRLERSANQSLAMNDFTAKCSGLLR